MWRAFPSRIGFADRTCRTTAFFDNGGMKRARQSVWWSLACMVLAGCAAPGSAPITYGVRHFPGGDRAAAYAAARSTLDELGYAIDHADRAAGLLTTRPTSHSRHGERTGVRISSRGDLRRVVRVRVAATADTVNVYCQAAIQERLTETHRILQHDLATTDRPGETPIDRGAGTTPEQNTVWRTIRRNKIAERRILEDIVERLTGSTPPPDSPTNGP